MPNFDIHTANLRAINSLTKYPSIPTYHQLDPRNGCLTDEVTKFDGPVILTEKIDGTNSRIIMCPDGSYLIGSRENLLYAQGDLIGDPAQGIVAALRDILDYLPPVTQPNRLMVVYGEVYGGKVTGASRQYTARRAVGFRVFDVAIIDALAERLTWASERISGWRDRGGQAWLDEDGIQTVADDMGLDVTPRLLTIDAADLPTGIDETHEWLKRWPTTRAHLDGAVDQGCSEGIVLRTPDRAVISKARFEDYARTLRRRQKAGR